MSYRRSMRAGSQDSTSRTSREDSLPSQREWRDMNFAATDKQKNSERGSSSKNKFQETP